jgi:hypothetical protein
MKRNFGGLLTRWLRGGVRLTDAEHFLLVALVRSLDTEIRGIVESHFEEYNLAQREADGRAINFYRVRLGRRAPLGVSKPLQTIALETPLIRIAVAASNGGEALHAVLTAVGGRAFCVTFDRAPQDGEFGPGASVIRSIQSWKSEVRAQPPV